MKTIFIWDIENISVRKKSIHIMEQLAYKPNVLFAVSKRPASKSEILTFEKYNIEHRQSDTIADILILKILKEHKDYDNFIIISSDSDFCVFFDEIMNKNIQWFLERNKSTSVLKKTFQSSKNNNISYTYLPSKKNVELNQNNKPIIYNSFTTLEEKKYFLKENKCYLQESLRKIALKYNLDKHYLEELVDRYRIKREDIVAFNKNLNKAEGTISLRLKFNAIDHIIKQVIHRIEHFLSKQTYGQCVCCQQYNVLQDSNYFCNSCHQKFYLEFGLKKELTHKEKLNAFREQVIYEKEIFGGIIYPMEKIDLLKKELLLQYPLPSYLDAYNS